MMAGEVKRREELKRERAWDPALRWKVLQETITWAEMQGAGRNTPKAALAAQDRLRRGASQPQSGAKARRPGPRPSPANRESD